jgi:hypothetical protein
MAAPNVFARVIRISVGQCDKMLQHHPNATKWVSKTLLVGCKNFMLHSWIQCSRDGQFRFVNRKPLTKGIFKKKDNRK